jgi:hypothetical protein
MQPFTPPGATHRNVKATWIALVLAAAGCRPGQAPPGAAPVTDAAPPSARETMRELDRVASRDLWPGFRPESIPVALYDGERTWLFRHPAPPAGYEPVAGATDVLVRTGRDSLVWANSSVTMNGVRTATVMSPARGASATSHAAVIAHEMFHVFQRTRHAAWTANEAELFTYPVADAGQLALRRAESEALRRALDARTDAERGCWANRAVRAREERFAALTPGARGYERGSEWHEGLAAYVQARAAGSAPAMPADEFPAEDVRQRFYAVGPAMGAILDRLMPGWRDTLERADTLALDALLAAASARADTARCALTAAERTAIADRARDDVTALRTRLDAERAELLRRPGWTVVIVAGATPLWPQGFDPLNVRMVGEGLVLHRRMVRLGNDAGSLDVLNVASLTEAAGAHPLFSGVRRFTVTGLASDPVAAASGGTVRLEADGLRGEFRGATLVRSDHAVEVRLGP